jgi:endoglucanase
MMKHLVPLPILAVVLAVLGLSGRSSHVPAGSPWTVTAEGYLDSPAVSILVFHDYYPEGKQGGIEIIQHGERVAADGDVRLEFTPGQWGALPTIGKRKIDLSGQEIRVPGSFVRPALSYTVRVEPAGEAVRVSVDLDRPLPAGLAGKVSFNLELFPSAYFGKSYTLGAKSALFPRQPNGPLLAAGMGMLRPIALAAGPKLVVAAEDPERMMTIESRTGDLELYDGRNGADNGWFVVRSALAAGKDKGAAEWIIAPHRIPGWIRPPVVAVSQVGYHPDQAKRAVIELDRRSGAPGRASLLKVDPAGGWDEVWTSPVVPWPGAFLRYDYAIFDFSPVREPGLYAVRYGSVQTPPFKIGRDVYRDEVWQPTLETYLPVQMCHVAVRDVCRIWHGACHLDDALQAPPSTVHFDSYQQGARLPDRFAAFEHIPYLNRGGWHDAGDFDLAAGSQAQVTLLLALIRETFGLATDQTAISQARRLVVLHDPDGVPDILQQVEHGAECLLSGYRAAGHSFSGVIEGSVVQYSLIGDTASMTDNRVYDSTLRPGEVVGERSGVKDDRWAFTDPDTSLEYKVAAALAAGRVLKGSNDALARECLETSLKVWDREQSRAPVAAESAYVPGRPEVQEVLAAVELLVATGQARFGDRIVSLRPAVEKNFGEVGWAVARILPSIKDAPFREAVERAASRYAEDTERELASNPFGVLWRPEIWGIGWDIQDFAVGQYFLIKAFPGLFRPETIFRVLNYVLGCHPGSSVSFVSGVGARSLTIGYGFNRMDWSYIPGMNASGTALIRPDFPELKDDFPFLWQQAENVIGGAASYVFVVLAADELLNGPALTTPGRPRSPAWP